MESKKSVDATLADHSARIKVCEKRLEKVEKVATSVQDLALSVKEIAVNQSRMLDDIKAERERRNKNEERIHNLETQPAKDAHDLKQKVLIGIITGVVSIILGAVLGLVIKG